MAGNGLSGFVDGLISGIQPGLVIGDAIAKRRSSGRMEDVQAQIDSGAFDPNSPNFRYTDTAEAQAALHSAVRNAQSPLSRRGLDDSYGNDQYARTLRDQQQTGDQQAGVMANRGDLAGALARSGQVAGAMGNLPGAVQADQAAGQVRAGTAAVGADGKVDQEALARGVSANNAMHGDASGAAAWGAQQKQQAQAAVQGMLGRAMTVATNPQLGGLEAAVPYIHSAAKLLGYGDAMWSPSTKTIAIVDGQGKSIANINEQTLPQFLQTIGNDPEQILPAIRASQTQQVQDLRSYRQDTAKQANQARFDAAGKNWTDPRMEASVQSAQTRADELSQKASLAGWKIDTGTGMDVTDPKGNVVGKKWFAQPPGGGQPVVITMQNPDPNNPVSAAFSVTNQQGQPVDMTGSEGSAFSLAVQAQQAQAQAIQLNLAYNHQRQLQQQANITDAYSAAMGGNGPAMASPAEGVPASLQDYQSPHADLDAAQMHAESSGNQGAMSPKGARGVMQLMPETAAELEQEFGLPAGASSANTPQGRAINQKLGQVYRDRLIDNFTEQTGNPTQGRVLGLMAYNWGPGNMQNWLVNDHADPRKVPAETKNYVGKILQGGQGKRTAAPNSGIMGTLSEKARATTRDQINAGTRAVPRELLPNGASSKYLFKG